MVWGTSQRHWWSGRRCVMVERIDAVIAVHDVGPVPGRVPWVTYPAIPHQLHPSSGDVLDNHHTIEHMGLDTGSELVAGAIGDLASDMVLGRVVAKRAQRLRQRMSELLAMPVQERRTHATLVLDAVTVEQRREKGSREGRWLLSSASPLVRIYVACTPRDVAAITESLSHITGT